MTLLVKAMIFSFDEIREVHLEVVRLVVLFEHRLRVSYFLFFLSLQHLLRPNRLKVLLVFTDSVEQAILILKFIDFPLVFIDKFFIVVFLQQLFLHRIDYVFKRAEFSLEKWVDVFALLWCPWLLEESGEVLVEVDWSAFAEPVGKSVIVA